MRSRVRVFAVVLLAATLATAFSTTLAYQLNSGPGGPPPLWRLALLNGSFWFGWAGLAWPLASLSRHLRIDHAPRLAVPAHIVALVAAACLHVGLQAASQVVVLRSRLAELSLKDGYVPDRIALLDWFGQWRVLYPSQMTQLVDWELATGLGIVAIAHAFFYYREVQRRALETAHLETRLVDAQLRALQSQLHPHFLFNTLHAISTLMHRDVPAADRMLIQLGDLLRMTLDSVAHPEARLTGEMDFLEKYLQIEQVRLGDRLIVKFDVDPEVLDAVVPGLLLQPLVENAIRHGIAPTGRPGTVTVAARREGEMLVMTVTDTGPGPGDRAMAALSTGIGLSNTRARLTHQFGARYRFEFRRSDGEFAVCVAIPLRRDPPTPVVAAGAPVHA
jgi:signal transduction histidine kinase